VNTIDVHKALQTLCKTSVVRRDYIHLAVLEAVFQKTAAELHPHLIILQDLGYIKLRHEALSLTETGVHVNLEM
jgi:hypothetical protein